MITQEFKDKWVAALRSGDYPQTQGKLRRENGFCCLGVFCDLTDSSRWTTFVTSEGEIIHRYGDNEIDNYQMIRDAISCTQQLIDMNDNKDKNFVEIAAFIEENVNVV